MNSEYAVKISLTEHLHDNFERPYYWSLLKFDTAWHQIAFGWETKPEECFSAAMDSYYQLIG